MRWLVGVGIILALLCTAAGLLIRAASPPPTPVYIMPAPPDPEDDTRWEVLKTASTVLLVVVGTGLVVAGAIRVGVYLRRAWIVADLVYTDSEGRWPVERTQLADPRYGALSVGAWHQTQLARAQASRMVPHTYHVENAAGILDGEFEEVSDNPLADRPPPTFAELLASGTFGPGRPLVLGFTDEGPMTGDWKKLYSAAVAGLSGTGKTTTLRFLAAQAALQGARFVILDPHAEAGEDSLADTLAPLSSHFLAPPAMEPPRMLELLEMARGILEDRLHGGDKAFPLIVVVDEFTGLMGRSDLAGPLAELIEQIAQEGRKVQVYALVSGQIFTAARAGGSALRDAFASSYVHRMKRNQARLLLPADVARLAETLATGVAFLYQTSGEITQVRIPLTTGQDMEVVGGMLTRLLPPATAPALLATGGDWPATPATGAPEQENRAEAGAYPSRPVAGEDLDTRVLDALALFDEGMGLPDAVATAFNVSKKSPNSFNGPYGQVQKALRQRRLVNN